MKIAYILYDGMSALDLTAVSEPLASLKPAGLLPDLEWELCALSSEVRDQTGLRLLPTRAGELLNGYDLVVVPGGGSVPDLTRDREFIEWLKSAAGCPLKAASGSGLLLWLAAGLGEGDVIAAGGAAGAIELGLSLCDKLAGRVAKEQIRLQMGVSSAPFSTGDLDAGDRVPRTADVQRSTSETQISVQLNIDGSGAHRIDTGIGFLDHMLTHLAVHGLFDLAVQASGDLQIDDHHTVEDVALALGQAFDQALGGRKGLVRTASAYVPMDETLAFIAVDLSGRPYAVVDVDWRSPSIGSTPATLFTHLLESFASAARCNLHARLLYGRDDHHQAEALFKALARALDAATTLDPRRLGAVPSTKGTLTA
jgi:imidazoleglycerol-phosphate dehydratase